LGATLQPTGAAALSSSDDDEAFTFDDIRSKERTLPRNDLNKYRKLGLLLMITEMMSRHLASIHHHHHLGSSALLRAAAARCDDDDDEALTTKEVVALCSNFGQHIVPLWPGAQDENERPSGKSALVAWNIIETIRERRSSQVQKNWFVLMVGRGDENECSFSVHLDDHKGCFLL
jgi:hypothetical protein